MTTYHHHVNVQTGEKTKVAVSPEEETAIEARKISFVADKPKRDAMVEISRLEATVTPRRIRDATTSVEGETWLADIESKIAIERVKLNG